MLGVQFLGDRLHLFNQRRAGFPVLGKLAGGQEQAGGAVAQQVVVVHLLALEVRHGHRVGARRRRLAVLEQLAGVAAVVIGALEELAEAAGAQLHFAAALFALQRRAVVALDAEFALLHHVAVAVRVVAADVQLALFVDQVVFHRRAALGAALLATQLLGLRFLVVGAHRLFAGQQVEGGGAALLGRQAVARAPQEHAGGTGADLHRAPAFGALDVGVGGQVGAHAALGLLAAALALGRFQLGQEVPVELVEHVAPAALALGDLIQGFLHLGGEVVVHQVGEAFRQPVGDDVAHLLRVETAVVLTDIAPVLDGGNNRGVGGGPADAALLQFLHQTGFGVARRRLGEVLVGVHLIDVEHVALLEIGQHGVLGALARRLGLDAGPAVELDDAAAGLELVAVGLGGDGGAQVLRRRHLAGDELAADQLVKALGVALHVLEVAGVALHVRGADRFVGFLGAVAVGVPQRLLGQVLVTQLLADPGAAVVDRIRAQVGGIGTHIGDVAGLVEALGHHHGLLHPEAQARAGGLLQGGSNKGRRRLGAGRALLALADGELARGHQGGAMLLRVVAVVGAEVLAPVTGHLHADGVRRVGRVMGVGVQLPVLFRGEGADFPLALHHQLHRHRLHPAGGQAAGDLLPQQRRDHEAHHPVQEAARLLGFHPAHVELARLLEGGLDRFLGDLVEHHPVEALVVAADHFPQVPGDRLPFAVQVSGEVDAVGAAGEPLELVDHLFLARQDLILRLPAVVRVHAHAVDQLRAGLLLFIGFALLLRQ